MRRLRRHWPQSWPVQPVPGQVWQRQEPTFAAADPAIIEAALHRAQSRPAGNWFVLAASREIRADRPFGARVAGAELVAWRDAAGALLVGPGACPHLGAPLAQATVDSGALVCRWHGLRLSGKDTRGWSPLPCMDDGVLAWVRLDARGGETPAPKPPALARPAPDARLDAVATMVGVCEPEDVVANRLDPWHGSWFHPYSFAHLQVVQAPSVEETDPGADRFLVDVTFRIGAGLGVPVRAEFACPGPRTVVMTILDGEGAGSVVETHATPLGSGADGRPRTAVIEATVARSARTGFAHAARAAPAIRPLMRWAARRLWRDDLAYAERRYALRAAGG